MINAEVLKDTVEDWAAVTAAVQAAHASPALDRIETLVREAMYGDTSSQLLLSEVLNQVRTR